MPPTLIFLGIKWGPTQLPGEVQRALGGKSTPDLYCQWAPGGACAIGRRGESQVLD